MPTNAAKLSFIDTLKNSFIENSFVKCTLGDYKGTEGNLKNIYLKKIIVKRVEKISFVYRYQTKDITKNFSLEEAVETVEMLLAENLFNHAQLFTLNTDLKLQYTKQENWIIKQEKASQNKLPSTTHDHQKNRIITSKDKTYLQELRITDQNGEVFKSTQDKYKQINHYIEILSSLLKELPSQNGINVVDMGAGKGYLTFALYDYLVNVLQKNANIIGVEFRKDLVELCNSIAKKSSFQTLNFVEGTIEDYKPANNIDVLIALHACDTATDDAICKGVVNNATLIVVAPCCHKQIRNEMEQQHTKNELDFLTRYGTFLERQAEMVTDGIRALVLEYFGYTTKVFEFVSDAHTPKNVLIVGIKKQHTDFDKNMIVEKIKTAKKFFGIEYHYLEKLLPIK